MILQTERAQEGSINDRCPAQSVIFAEAADASPGATARIAIHGAGIIAALFERALNLGNIRVHDIRGTPAVTAMRVRRRRRKRRRRHDDTHAGKPLRDRTGRTCAAGSTRSRTAGRDDCLRC